MKKINFSTTINATKERVWEILWDLDHYKKWTSVFAEGSTVKTDNWKQGSKVEFLDGKGNGMVSEVVTNRPGEYMAFKHLGEIKEGKVDMHSEAVKTWTGAEESYSLLEKDGKTELNVEMDTTGADFEAFLIKAWPKALETIKSLAESPAANQPITVTTTVAAPMEKVWEFWNEPKHITQWCFASDDWHAPKAENDLRVGGTLKTRMEAKDGSMGFDFEAVYTKVKPYFTIEYNLGDGRHVTINFEKVAEDKTRITETFDPESQNSPELQRGGWQAILDNFKKHTEHAH